MKDNNLSVKERELVEMIIDLELSPVKITKEVLERKDELPGLEAFGILSYNDSDELEFESNFATEFDAEEIFSII